MNKVRIALWYKLETLVLKLGSERSKIRRSYLKAKDEGLGRERIGVDKFGNAYYQYYSYHGLPTRRIVLYKFFDSNKFHIDPHFLGWLRKNDLLPPTPEQLEKAYLEHDAFVERGLQWDKEQQLILREWEDKKKLMDQQHEHRSQLSGGVESWKPEPVKDMVPISDIDLIERDYLQEFDQLIGKDKDLNKDFNKLAYQDLKKAQYFFEYMRTSEKLYRADPENNHDNQSQTSGVPVLSTQEQELFEGRAQQRLNTVLASSKPLRERSRDGEIYSKFKEEFKDMFEMRLNQNKRL